MAVRGRGSRLVPLALFVLLVSCVATATHCRRQVEGNAGREVIAETRAHGRGDKSVLEENSGKRVSLKKKGDRDGDDSPSHVPRPSSSPSTEDGVRDYTSKASLQDTAAQLLEEYARAGKCVLVRAGYLDLLGNNWSCTVVGDGWVDTVVVRGAEDSRKSEVKVVRMDVKEWEEGVPR